jgi:peroxiredoxin
MEVVGWVLLATATLAVMALWFVVYQLVRQQGRILLRLDELESRWASGPPEDTNAHPRALPVATSVPSFRLPDLTGSEVTLEDLTGRRLLLVHWDPQCSFCGQIATELGGLRRDLGPRRTDLVLLSYRDAEANSSLARQSNLDCQILLQREGEPVEAFAGLGTPAAYLVDEKGRVAKPLALGSEQVLALARAAAGHQARSDSSGSLARSRIEREGLPAGTPAPSFRLRDLDGQEISLEQYRGRRVLLVFSDPECGPCDAVAADLARFDRERRADDVDLLMVSRGDPDENRRKAIERGMEFPVLIQPGWRVSKQYGIFATPVAFLVDERGLIARDVARGGPEILRLAVEGLAVREEALME